MGALFNLTINKAPSYTNPLSVHQDRRSILFVDFASAYLAKCRKSACAKKAYQSTFNHFVKFCTFSNLSPMTYEIGMEVMEDFMYYMQSVVKLMSSTVAGHLVHFKTLLKMASYSGYDIDFTYSDINLKKAEIDVVTLDRDEITQIYVYEGLTRKEEKVRDLFIIACMTGLRFSDYSKLTEQNFVDNLIQVKTQKTGTLVLIPQSKYVRNILHKYENRLPKCPCVQHFNKTIKQICRKVGINQPIPYERIIGLERVSIMKEKWELIGSHTGRRSAATNMFMAGIPALRIMMITGHKTEAAFMRYIGLTKEENAATLAGNMFFH